MPELIDGWGEILGGLQTAWARLSGAAPRCEPNLPPATDPAVTPREENEAGRDRAPVLGSWTGGPLESIPQTRPEVYRVFGNPGEGRPSRTFQRRNLTTAKGLPGRWNNNRGRLYIHRLAEPYLREALRRADDAGVLGELTRMGCYNFRHQRHDKSRPLSYHSWAIALDLNSAQNRARRFRPGKAPVPFSDEWKRLWPNGVSEDLVLAFESVGWSWGGRWKLFKDNMHFELVA